MGGISSFFPDAVHFFGYWHLLLEKRTEDQRRVSVGWQRHGNVSDDDVIDCQVRVKV